jgi:hypothetical protein
MVQVVIWLAQALLSRGRRIARGDGKVNQGNVVGCDDNFTSPDDIGFRSTPLFTCSEPPAGADKILVAEIVRET